MTDQAESDDALSRFLPAVSSWFRNTLGEPTPPQRLGWPPISAGENTLIVAPTGSGKTLAAFLAGLDLLWRTPRLRPGVRILYVSPLKALNEDVRRNLEIPLAGILECSDRQGSPLSPLQVAVRSGDTPAGERARIQRKPPDILITTPESLHLMLTSQVRAVLSSVTHVIVDEIHAICSNKRGVFLALLLERLEAMTPSSFVRIGLSATQRPLDEVARYLGGQRVVQAPDGARRFEARAVTLVDAGQRKTIDVRVLWPGPDDGRLVGPPGSIWPAIEERLVHLVQEHRSTIVFANNRRTVERLTSRLNEAVTQGSRQAPPEDAPAWFRAHHGSLSLQERRGTEEELKSGQLKAVIATASLELGIDMGDVDLVCQVESPGNVARGLQRVGRAGHVVHGVSKGRLLAKTPSDLLETAALARAMVRGQIEELRVPHNCLDVLAQHVIACVAVDRWDVSELFEMVRRAYPYRDLSADVFERVLRLVSGRFPAGDFRDLRARIAWDRVHNRLAALPGTARLALVSGGTIPDTGQFPVYLGEGGPRLGELDEEFVFERRVGETFTLGNNTWRIQAIEAHKVLVGTAEGHHAVMPFWRGESVGRSAELGQRVGELCREISGRLGDPELPAYLVEECRLEPRAAQQLMRYIGRQLRAAGVVPDDRTLLVETFRDPAGELGLAVLSPFGGALHQGLKLALLGRIRQRFGLQASCLHGNDGLLIRLPGMECPPLDLLEGLSGDEAERLIRLELPETAQFGLRFRQSAARALIMPRPDPGKRTPLWLQRLRAKDLLQVVGKFPDHPIVMETFRECLEADLDLPRLRALLASVQAGGVKVVRREAEIASPFASDLIFKFTPTYMYEWDGPRRGELRSGGPLVDEDLLSGLLTEAGGSLPLDPQAVGRVEARLRRRGLSPRSLEEMAETLRMLGDLSAAELFGPMESFLRDLEAQCRATQVAPHGKGGDRLWISCEEHDLYRRAFENEAEPDQGAVETIIRRYLRTHALIGLAELVQRYPVRSEHAAELLERWVEEGGVIHLKPGEEASTPHWAERDNLVEMRRLTLAIRRRESLAVTPEAFVDFLVRRQLVGSACRLDGPEGVEQVLELLQGRAFPADVWEEDILPRRVRGYRPSWLDDLLAAGGWSWRACADGCEQPHVAFARRDFPGDWSSELQPCVLAEDQRAVLELLEQRGASFAVDLARASALEPSRVRRILRQLMVLGKVTNDRLDPLRAGAEDRLEALAAASEARVRALSRGRSRTSRSLRPEGRWSRIDGPALDRERHLLAWIQVLLGRHGVLTRELVELESWAPPWADLVPLLARAEMQGELRRGYFVEGLSGVQYASQDVAEELSRCLNASAAESGEVLLSAADPANLYGGGAPLDIPLLEGGKARLARLPGNYLVLRQGRPVLIIEAHGRRLTGLAWASDEELRTALGRLTELACPARRVLKVETYNGEPALTSAVAPRLAELGFVRDYPGMTYYAAWAPFAGATDSAVRKTSL